MVKKINSSEFEQVKNNKAIIVDFSAEWCGPCKMLAPVMEQLSDEITDVEFYNIDVDENPSEQLVDENIAHEGKAVQIFEIEVEYLSGKEIQER